MSLITKRSILFLFLLILGCFGVRAAEFEPAVEKVLKHEGYTAVDLGDGAGYTRYGITLRYLDSYIVQNPSEMLTFDVNGDKVIDALDIRGMKKEMAVDLYRRDWWDKYGYDRIQAQVIAEKVFDMSVNMGHRQSIKLLQRAHNRFKTVQVLGLGLKEDGYLNENFVKSINRLGHCCSESLLKFYKDECRSYYLYISKNRPVYQKFLKGWLRRVED